MLDRVPGGTTESKRDGQRRSRATSTQAIASPSAAPAIANSTLCVTGKAPGGRTSAATANVATADRPSEATKRLGIAWRLRIGRRLPTSAQVSRPRWRNIDPHAERRQRIRNHVTASFKASFGAEYEQPPPAEASDSELHSCGLSPGVHRDDIQPAVEAARGGAHGA